jgi:hypothetical protein
MEDARAGAFDVLIAETLDRLSRDQEDVPALLKRLRFAASRSMASIYLGMVEVSDHARHARRRRQLHQVVAQVAVKPGGRERPPPML